MIRFATSHPSSRTVGRAPLHLRQLVLPGLLVLAIGGLTMQALQGDRGWRGWMNLQAERAERQLHLAALQRDNELLAQRVARLGNEALDLDFLDERARIVLGLTGKNDTVIVDMPR